MWAGENLVKIATGADCGAGPACAQSVLPFPAPPEDPTHMAGVDVPRFLGAEVGDNPDTWRAAGLHVDAGGVCNVGSVAFTLTGTGARGYRSLNPGVASYTIATPAVSSPEERTVLGLTVKLVPAVVEQPAGPSEPHPHPSGASRIMKTVILGCDTDATVNALSDALGDTIMNQTNSDPGGDGNHFAIWRMRGMEMFEVADLLRTDPRNADGDLVLPPRREQFEFEGIYHTGQTRRSSCI